MVFNKKKKERQNCEQAIKALGLPDRGWWSRSPERATVELWKLLQNTSAQIHAQKDTLIIKEWITTNFGTSFLVRIDAKDFPFKMPQAFIESPRIKPKAKYHFYKNGSLCLFQPSEWRSTYSLLKVRNHVAAWCFSYEAAQHNGGKWPAAEKWHLF